MANKQASFTLAHKESCTISSLFPVHNWTLIDPAVVQISCNGETVVFHGPLSNSSTRQSFSESVPGTALSVETRGEVREIAARWCS